MRMFSNLKSHLARCARPFQAVVIFVCLQVLFSLLLSGVSGWLHLSSVAILIVASLLSNLFTIIWLFLAGYAHLGQLRYGRSRGMIPMFVLLQMTFAVGMNVAVELCEVPDMLAEQFAAILSNPWGIIAVAIVAPVAEEVVFRSALLGGMIDRGYSARTAILVSAFVFGLIHGNPVQIIFASALGILLGWSYWRSGSLLPCVLMHLANNSASVCMMYLSDNQMGRITDNFSTMASLCLMVAALCGAYALFRVIDKQL